MFESKKSAQVFLIPNAIGPLNFPFPMTPEAINVPTEDAIRGTLPALPSRGGEANE